MDNKEFSKLLEKRTRDFGIRIIRLLAKNNFSHSYLQSLLKEAQNEASYPEYS